MAGMFQDRKLVIATKHRKEQVIAPIIESEWGVLSFADGMVDTDELGTFSGEIPRTLDPLATVKEKCLRAMRANNCDLGIASEGAFGPHPQIYFVNADEEFLVLMDSRNNLEVLVRELSLSTNFNGKQVQSQEELLDFAEQVGFPDHGLILRKSANESMDLFKGIQSTDTLMEVFEYLLSKYASVYVETDMRAMYNPTRMKVIEQATRKLVQKVNSTCPQCQTPGFGIVDAKMGLKCGLCQTPTNSVLSYLYVCDRCQFVKEEMYPNQKTSEDPMYCNVCNP